MNTVQISTVTLVSQFEGLSLVPYQDQGGVWTYGYGATIDLNGNPVTSRTQPISLNTAEVLLGLQLKQYADAVNESIKVTLNQNQFDACVSLCYNIGIGGFESSTVCREINENNFPGAAQAFIMWDEVSGEVNDSLLNRRKKEMALFLS